MEIRRLSDAYDVRKLNRKDAEDVYALWRTNPLYFAYCPPEPSVRGAEEDMQALPPGKSMQDKYYVGFFHQQKLIAVLDLITGYPEEGTVWIGFFMTDASVQNRGLGTSVITEVLKEVKNCGYSAVKLAWVKGNPQAEHFWKKNGFVPYAERKGDSYDLILAERIAA